MKADCPADAPTINQPVAERPGTLIGPYKLVEEIGEGGMGSVYMALQKEPVRRKVALKIIKPGMDSKQVVSRFEAERQALALMDHPNIARVFDGGATPSGRPYFVMELVNGIPITDYCDRYRLTTDDRLELFGDVCQAVQHAHQKGIIHRDLKPSNILVTLLDDRAIPKVIDFGIAKATSGHLTDESLVTDFAQVIGTPMYMSPEQAELSGADVDTRSDVYSLGVLLYELLTGTTPFDRGRLSSVSFDEFRRIVREEEPPKPSTRLSTLDAALETVAEKHHTDSRTLSQQVRGELDWIVMKALEKDRTRRYETASAFAKDIQRYLHDEVVEACPPSRVYRLCKFARHNKTVLTSTAVVLVGSIMLLVATTLVAISQREIAERRLTVQAGINDALTEVARLQGQTQVNSQDGDATLSQAREQLQRALAFAASGLADEKLVAQVQALSDDLDQEQRDRQFLAALDEAWLNLGDMQAGEFAFDRRASIPVMRDAFEAYGLPVEKVSPEQAAAMIRTRPEAIRQELLVALDVWRLLLGTVGVCDLKKNDDGVFIEAVVRDSPIERDGRLKPGDRLIGIGDGRDGSIVDTRTLALPKLRELVRGKAGEFARLKVIPKGANEARIYEIPPDPVKTWLQAVVDAADSDPWRRRVRKAFDLGDESERRSTLQELLHEADIERQPVRILTGLAEELSELEATDDAISFLRRVRQTHPSDLHANESLATILRESEPPQLEEAVRYFTAAIALRPDSAGLHHNLGNALRDQGKLEEAVIEYREAVRLGPRYAAPRAALGDTLMGLGRPVEAIAECREAVRLEPKSVYARRSLGCALKDGGKLEEAIAEHREAIRLKPEQSWNHYNLGNAFAAQGKLDAAATEFREAIRLEPKDGQAHNNLGSALLNQGKIEEAITEYREAIRVEPKYGRAYGNLGGVLGHQGKIEEGISVLREGIRVAPEFGECHNILAWQLATSRDPKLRQPTEAVELAKKAVSLEPTNGGFWNTLGVAQYRAGDHQGAIESINRSLALDSRNCAIDWLILSIAHWGVGRKDEARTWYDKAAQWMEQHSPKDQDLLSFRAEAIQVLGIPDEPSKAKEQSDTEEQVSK